MVIRRAILRKGVLGALAACAIAGAGGAAADDDAARDAFLRANLLNTLFHEIGHAVIHLRDIPILGREEDAADGFASVAMIEGGNPVRMLDVIEGWALAAEAAPDEISDEELFGDHALDEQRMANALCDLIGARPHRFGDVAYDFDLDDDRIAFCEEEYQRRKRSWKRVLTGGPKKSAPISIEYAPTPNFPDILARVRAWRVAEAAARHTAARAYLPEPLTIRFEECGEANAWYDPEAVLVSVCYDYIAEMAVQFSRAD